MLTTGRGSVSRGFQLLHAAHSQLLAARICRHNFASLRYICSSAAPSKPLNEEELEDLKEAFSHYDKVRPAAASPADASAHGDNRMISGAIAKLNCMWN